MMTRRCCCPRALQEMAAGADRSDAAVAAYVEGRKREWLAGLARGLTLAGHPPLQPDAVYYPFYGNLLADLITAHERAGGHAPDLEAAPVAVKAAAHPDDLILEAAAELGFRPSRRLARTDPELVAPIIAVERARAAGGRGRLVRSAQAADRPRGAAVPRREDRYLGVPHPAVPARRGLLPRGRPHARRGAEGRGGRDRPRRGRRPPRPGRDRAQSRQHRRLRHVFRFTASIRVRLLVTAGSPLGYPIVRRNLRGGAEGVDDRPVPAVLDPIPGTPGRDRVWWLNAFDVLDVVALVHPLASRFSAAGSGSATSARSTRPTRTRSRTTCPTRTSPARSGTCWPTAERGRRLKIEQRAPGKGEQHRQQPIATVRSTVRPTRMPPSRATSVAVSTGRRRRPGP